MIHQSIHLTRGREFDIDVTPFLHPEGSAEPFVAVKMYASAYDPDSKDTLSVSSDVFISSPEDARKIAEAFLRAAALLRSHEAKVEAEKVQHDAEHQGAAADDGGGGH